MLESIEKLYSAFDGVFPRPVSFQNEGCCVTRENEQLLLDLPRELWAEEMLAMPMDHSDGCFGTFAQVSYLVPRLIEILSERDGGFEYGVLDVSFYRYLLGHEDDYRALGLWEAVENAVVEIFRYRTATFAIAHYDLDACRRKGWDLDYFDRAIGTDMVEELLGEFFYRKSLKHLKGTGPQATEWDALFERWSDDGNANRIAYLLDLVKLHCGDNLVHEFRIPASLLCKLREGLAGQLVDRAWSVISAVESPTWLRDLLRTLEMNVGYTRGG